MRILFRHLTGRDQGRKDTFPARRILLGRDQECDLRFDLVKDLEVSARHAEVIPGPAPDRWQILDLNSTNGTWVNGTEVKGGHELVSGDQIELGPGGPRLQFLIRNGWLERLRARLFGRRQPAPPREHSKR